jgi:flavin-dependent dehydrogenase
MLSLPPKSQSPAVTLNAVTVRLLHDIFGDMNYVLRDAQLINQHHINWDRNSSDEFTPSSGITLDGGVLSARLLDVLRQDAQIIVSQETRGERDEGSFEWRVYATNGPSADNNNSSIVPTSFGQRHAISAEVLLHDDSECATSRIESTPAGWLFLAPLAKGRGVLQGIVSQKPNDSGQTLRAVLGQTRQIKHIVRHVSATTYAVPCAPKKLSEMSGANWLATGTAACSYDPLCGDGTGYAVRAAILAAAVLEAIDRGTPTKSLLNYYKLRLTYAFYTHIRSCLSLYLDGGFDDSWRSELALMQAGVREVEQELLNMSTDQYRLDEYELSPAVA